MASARKVLHYAKLKASYGFTGNIVTSASPQLMMNYSLQTRSEEHTSELQSPDNISYAVFCLKKKFF